MTTKEEQQQQQSTPAMDEPHLLLSPRGSKDSAHFLVHPANEQQHHHQLPHDQASPVSVMGLYPVVHDLSDMEYLCGSDPLGALTEIFQTEEDSNHDDTQNKLVLELDEQAREDLQAPNLWLHPQHHESEAEISLLGELPDFIPPPPKAFGLEHRRRATSCEVVSASKSKKNEQQQQQAALHPIKTCARDDEETTEATTTTTNSSASGHRRAMSDGAGQYFLQVSEPNSNKSANDKHKNTPKTDKNNYTTNSNNNHDCSDHTSTTSSNAEKRFRDDYVLIRQVS